MYAYRRQLSSGRRIAALYPKRRTILRSAYSYVACKKHAEKRQNSTVPTVSTDTQTIRMGIEQQLAVKKMLEESADLRKSAEREIFYWRKKIGSQNTRPITNTAHSYATQIFYEQSCSL